MRRTTYLAWLSIAGAVALAAGVGLLALTVEKNTAARVAHALEEVQHSIRQANKIRAHALARETRLDRDALDVLVTNDVLQMIGVIERVGTDAGVRIEIGQSLAALPGTLEQPLNTVGFVVQADGSYAALLHAVELFHSLPYPSAVDQVQFEFAEDEGKAGVWKLSVRLRFFTISELPS